ncbi:rap guanine nucleotide exchange factor 1-like [Lampetra planeri]
MGGASPSVATPCSEQEELFLVDYQEIIRRLVLRSQVDSGPDLKGGSQDILIVHATMADKKQYLVFCEAFIVTYRTFISSEGLLRKLIMRYRHLSRTEDAAHTRARRNALSLLLRVTDDLCVSELTDEVVCLLAGVVCACVTGGDLPLARPLRDTLVTRVMARRAHAQATSGTPLASLAVSARPASVHDFRSLELAEQLTLLDSELLQKIEIPEVLLWAKDQNDEKSPNLTRFTEHFNAVSYWAQTVLIQADKQSERERLAHKFLKIMKHLRRLNNYNSYLALLSALEASAIARLTWPKSVTETMAEFRQLIDSSGSFSNYRSALEKAQPPCLPYLGLILQDLTFVHMGNPDLIAGRVNFSKRWQQFNILQSLRTFLHCRYEFQRVDSVLSCFDGFTARLGEESLYELSLAIKPRAQRRHCDQLTA